MDKNTIIGLVLIFAIFIGFTQLTKPSDKEIALKRHNDSIALVEQKKAETLVKTNSATTQSADSAAVTDTTKLADAFGGFSPAA